MYVGFEIFLTLVSINLTVFLICCCWCGTVCHVGSNWTGANVPFSTLLLLLHSSGIQNKNCPCRACFTNVPQNVDVLVEITTNADRLTHKKNSITITSLGLTERLSFPP